MKILFNLPNGYSADITKARETNDLPAWVDGKFGARIRSVISEDFTIKVDDASNSFVVEFTYSDDGYAFLRTFGGIELGN